MTQIAAGLIKLELMYSRLVSCQELPILFDRHNSFSSAYLLWILVFIPFAPSKIPHFYKKWVFDHADHEYDIIFSISYHFISHFYISWENLVF